MSQSPFSSEAAPRLPTPSAASGTDKSGGTVSAKPSSSQVLAENAGRVGAYSSGTHLNLTWSVADTDRVLHLARVERMTDLQIAKRMGRDVRREEIVRICADACVLLRLDPR